MSEIQLTNSQSLMLAGQRICPDSPLYNMAFRFDIYGDLNLNQLVKAIELVVQANNILRLQIADNGDLGLGSVTIDRSNFADIDPESLVTQPMDISVGCLRTSVYKMADEHHVWFINQHHLITDGASFVEFFQQVAVVYAGADPHRNSFERYLNGSEKAKRSQRFAASRAYWAQKCADVQTTTTAAHIKNATQRSTLELSVQHKQAITQFASDPRLVSISRELTLFSIIAATLLVLKHRLQGPQHTTLGMPMHGNRRKTIGPTLEIGFIDVAPAAFNTFTQLVLAVQSDALRAMQHCVPGVTTAQANNSFDWLLNYLPGALNTFNGLACATEWLHPKAGDAAHDLRIQAHDLNATGGLILHFDAATRAFTPLQRANLPALFQSLLLSCLSAPDANLTSLQLASPAEQLDLRVMQQPAYRPLLEGFQKQLTATPNAVAVKTADAQLSLSYSELDALSTRLMQAHQDLEYWVLLLRGPDAIVAIIAALKAQKPFVPLDIDHPDARINAILDQLDAPPVFVAPEQLDRKLNSSKHYLVASANADSQTDSAASDASAHNLQELAPVADSPDSMAYIIFTSGTTGAPKGVVIGRASLSNYLYWAADAYTNQQPVDMPLYSSLAFDLTITSALLPLTTGGCVVTYGDTPGSSALSILQVLRDGATDLVKLTPSHLRLVLSSRNIDSSRLQGLILGGEDLPRSLALEAADRLGQPAIYNEYGPTEATIGCMIHRFDPVRDRSPSVPIGRAIDNSLIELVDHVGQPVPDGFDGQLVISGTPLAQTYWRGKSISTSRYFSGDRARVLDDGNLLYLGRMDNQVKFRGARIELAEIENELQSTGQVRAGVALISESVQAKTITHCTECGIADNVPRIVLNASDVCNVCEDYATKREFMAPYFRSLGELQSAIRERSSADADFDCLVLVSGGKDSSFTLCKIVELGLRPVVFTLDNGYLSEHALDNIRRITAKLNVPWVCETPEHMSEIFSDSLARHSNVCNGCFKTIYTLSTNYALKHGISSIVTGLSRGQLFETRLLDMVDTDVFNAELIDARVKSARIAYHKIDDAVSDHLDVSATRKNTTFDTVEYFDFYRYCDSSLDEMLNFLRDFGGWQRPPDTGRSTNCLINDVGIYVHQSERAHHNYAVPYAWDVRMGHKTRPQAVDELNDELDMIRVHEILEEIEYTPTHKIIASEAQLVAYYEPADGTNNIQHDLRAALQARLPDYAVPTQFVELDKLPLTPSGKIDYRALPTPDQITREYVAPVSDLEKQLATLWSKTLFVDAVGLNDNYFDLGGDSISAVQLAVLCASESLPIEPTHFFTHPTVSQLAEYVAAARRSGATTTQTTLNSDSPNNEPDTGLEDSELQALLNNTMGQAKRPASE